MIFDLTDDMEGTLDYRVHLHMISRFAIERESNGADKLRAPKAPFDFIGLLGDLLESRHVFSAWA